MTSGYVTQSEKAVAAYQDAARRFAKRQIETLLEQIWVMVDNHSPYDPRNRLSDDYLAGHRQACVELATLIEGLGGTYLPNCKTERKVKP